MLISTQLTFKIKPTSTIATPMTKVGTPTNLDVAFITIVGLAIGRGCTKGTFLQNDVRACHARQMNIGQTPIGTIIQNLIGRDIHVIVTGNKDFGANLLLLMGGGRILVIV